jgi:hypothetical protein
VPDGRYATRTHCGASLCTPGVPGVIPGRHAVCAVEQTPSEQLDGVMLSVIPSQLSSSPLQTSGTQAVFSAGRSTKSVNAAHTVGLLVRYTRTNTVDGHGVLTIRVEYSPGPETADAVSANCHAVSVALHARSAPQLPVSTSNRSAASADVNRIRGTPAPRWFTSHAGGKFTWYHCSDPACAATNAGWLTVLPTFTVQVCDGAPHVDTGPLSTTPSQLSSTALHVSVVGVRVTVLAGHAAMPPVQYSTGSQ